MNIPIIPPHTLVMSDEGFYLRDGTDPKSVKHVDLVGKPITLIGAKKSAINMGYAPTHWHIIGDERIKKILC